MIDMIKYAKAIFFLCLILTLSGCYRMPTEDDCSLVPTTNNPDITKDQGNSLIPGGGNF